MYHLSEYMPCIRAFVSAIYTLYTVYTVLTVSYESAYAIYISVLLGGTTSFYWTSSMVDYLVKSSSNGESF